MPQESKRKISVLGAGAWGTAVAIAVAARHDVVLWGRDAAAMAEMAATRDNSHYLKGYPFPPALQVSADFDAAVALAGQDRLLIAVGMIEVAVGVEHVGDGQPLFTGAVHVGGRRERRIDQHGHFGVPVAEEIAEVAIAARPDLLEHQLHAG